MKLCVFKVTETKFCMKRIRIFNAQPVKIPHFKSLLTRKQARWPHFFNCKFFIFISWMLITRSFKKRLIVEQFQGNYLKPTSLFVWMGQSVWVLVQPCQALLMTRNHFENHCGEGPGNEVGSESKMKVQALMGFLAPGTLDCLKFTKMSS